jgi:hypothetical protein
MAVAADAGASRLGRRIAAAATLSLLAACSSLPPSLSELLEPAPAPPPAQASEPPPAPPAPEPAPAPAAEADASPAARAARVTGRPPPGEPLRDLPRLVGASRELVIELLGPAGFVRRDGPVQIWRYTGDDCFLDLFLYREGDAFRVNHVEARAKNAGQVAVNTCYQRLVAARRAARSG